MMAPVLVPQTKSNQSASTRSGLFSLVRKSDSIRVRISTLIRPRMPPPSQVRIFLGVVESMRAMSLLDMVRFLHEMRVKEDAVDG